MMGKYKLLRGRKAQFFIVSAILLVMGVFTLNQITAQAWVLDLTSLQKDKSVWALSEIARDIAYIAKTSQSDTDLDARLSIYTSTQTSTMASEGYALSVSRLMTQTALLTNISISSEVANVVGRFNFSRA